MFNSSRFFKRPAVLLIIFLLVIFSVFYTSKSSSQLDVYVPINSSGDESGSEVTSIKSKSKESNKKESSSDENPDNTNEKETTDETSLDEIALTPFMPKMEDEELKAELGRSTWKLLHNVLARYPDKPSREEKASLKQFFRYFVKVYPCGDCAQHFQKLLDLYPPQVESKQNAALWGCHIHNKVNERLGKKIYDCTNILNDYDCGCGDDENPLFSLDDIDDDDVDHEQDSIASGSKIIGEGSYKDAYEKGALKETVTASKLDFSNNMEENEEKASEDEDILGHLNSIMIESKEPLQKGG